MALSVLVNILESIVWNETDTQDSNRRVSNIGEIKLTGTLTYGNGQIQVNTLYNEIVTIPSGEGVGVLDLFALPRTLFSGNFDVNFSGGNVKLIAIKNNGSGVNQDLTLAGTGSNGFSEPLGGSTGFPIPSRSSLPLFNPINGWTVSENARYLYVRDISQSGASYQLIIAGSK